MKYLLAATIILFLCCSKSAKFEVTSYLPDTTMVDTVIAWWTAGATSPIHLKKEEKTTTIYISGGSYISVYNGKIKVRRIEEK